MPSWRAVAVDDIMPMINYIDGSASKNNGLAHGGGFAWHRTFDVAPCVHVDFNEKRDINNYSSTASVGDLI